MNAITKERIELFIKNPLENGLTRGEQMELARIALASLDEEPVAWMCDDEDGREYNGHNEFSNGRRGIPLYAAPPALVVPHEWRLSNAQAFIERYSPPSVEEAALFAWNACRAAMLQSQREGNPHVTPARLPGGFTIEDAKELHEDLVRSHISQALSGEKMKKNDRDADLRWIHGVIVQAAWFVKASLEQNALSGNSPVTPDGWISCSERMPKKNQNVLISVNFDSDLVEPLICSARYTGSTFRRGDATIKPGNGIEQATHWMPLPEPPQEVNR
ncbi:DUF551 domain-containing protein [Escherichia coli]|nr:DUF551 domain-containing protein [Escherichia coli]